MIRALLAAALIALSVTPASTTQEPHKLACAPLPQMLGFLRDKHQEWVSVTAQAGDKDVYLTASRAGTWTLLVVKDRMACMVGVGSHLAWHRGI